MKKIILCSILAVFLTGFKATAQDSVHQLDSLFGGLFASGKFNGNVLIAKKGNVIYKKSFGYRNEKTKEKLDENSVFELASVSKQFTAMGIAILAEQGKLKYTDTLGKFFPELSFYKGVTIENLLHHTGGIPDYMDLLDSHWDKSKIATNKDVIAALANYKPAAVFAPGTKFEYSNTGYALLASVIEKASGETYPAFMQNHIFKPLHMDSSLIYTRRFSPKEIKDYAYGYVADSLGNRVLPDDVPGYSPVIWLDGIMGDGTVNSTVNDLLKWDRALYTEKLVSKKTLDRIFTSGTIADGSETDYGFGWVIENNSDYGRIVWHNGGWPGYIAQVERHLDNDVTIIILQNYEEGTLPIPVIQRIVYGKPLQAPERKEISLTADEMKQFTGQYELQPGYILTVTYEKGLKVQLTGQNKFSIYPETPTKFFLKVVDAELEFFRDDKGNVTKAVLHQNGMNMSAPKMQ